MQPESVWRRLSEHPHYERLEQWERALAHKLLSDDLPRRQLVLPFRADSKLGRVTVVAAETLLTADLDRGQVLMVVHDEALLEGWCEAWARYGRLGPDGLAHQEPGPLPVTITTVENLSRHEDAYRGKHYELVLTSGVGVGTVDYVTMAARGDRYWRLRPQEPDGYDYQEGSWRLGAAGAYLLDPRTWGLADPEPWSPFTRQRLSPLAS